MTKFKRIEAWLLSMALIIVSAFGIGDAKVSAAGADVKLSKKTVSLTMQKSKSGTKYGTAKVKIKRGKEVKIKKISCKVKKKSVAKVSVKGKSAPTLTIKAKKKGSTKVTVSVRYRKAGKIKTKKLSLNVKVAIKEGEKTVTSTPAVKSTQSPSDQTPSMSPAPVDGDETRSPGIYHSKTGALLKTWNEALSKNMITMDSNGMIISSSGVSSYSGEWTEYIDLVLSDEVKGIKAGAFGTQIECGLYLDKISIPASVQIIEKGAFGYFSFTDYTDADTSIKVDSGNPIYDSRNNCNAIIKTDTNELVIGCSRTVMPKDVTAIWDFAFSGCSNLKSIAIPNTVSSIGDSAFAGCTGLTSIHIPSKVTYIGNDAFSMRYLVSITVDSGNSTYDSRDNCNAIIKTSSNELMLGCQNTIIPNSVTSIGERAFSGYSELTNITIPNSVTSIGEGAFMNCDSLTNITIPNSVTSIGERAFMNCDSLTNITIPNSVTSIGEGAFSGCSSLTSITIPKSVVNIGENTFDSCENLTSVTISNGVVCISEEAFLDCERLESIEIPESVTNIEENAFWGCNALSNIVVDSKNSIYDSRENCNAIIETATNSLIKGGSKTIIPNGVTSIGENAFMNCDSLTNITIPNSVINIGDYAFYSCENLANVNILIGDLYIGERAFANCINAVITLEYDEGDRTEYGLEYVSNAFDNIKELIDNRDNDDDEADWE